MAVTLLLGQHVTPDLAGMEAFSGGLRNGYWDETHAAILSAMCPPMNG